MESVSVASNHFALQLFSKIKNDNKTGNVFYSPLSISSSLAMVFLGAAGNTATQMSEVLSFSKQVKPKSAQPVAAQHAQQTQKFQLPAALKKTLHHDKATDDIHDSFNKLMQQLNKSGAPYSLSLANRLYGERSYKFVGTHKSGIFWDTNARTVLSRPSSTMMKLILMKTIPEKQDQNLPLLQRSSFRVTSLRNHQLPPIRTIMKALQNISIRHISISMFKGDYCIFLMPTFTM